METKILHLDTATSVCSVALSIDGKPIASRLEEQSNQHTRLINLFISEVLTEAKWQMKDLDAISLTIGPGSYTGLRVGLSTAKGLCFGADIPMVVIGTLNALAQPFIGQNKFIIPTIDARRNEIYLATFDASGQKLNEDSNLIIEPNEYPKSFPNPEQTIICGNGGNKLQELLPIDGLEIIPSISIASNQAHIAYSRYKNKLFADIDYVKPNYLKPPNITTSKKNPIGGKS